MFAIRSMCPKMSMPIKAEVPCNTFHLCSGCAFIVLKGYPITFLRSWKETYNVSSTVYSKGYIKWRLGGRTQLRVL